MPDEMIYLEDDNVTVTSTHVAFGCRTYDPIQIQSVDIAKRRSYVLLGVVLLAAVSWFVCGTVVTFIVMSGADPLAVWLLLALTILFPIGCVVFLVLRKPLALTYSVKLTTSSGEYRELACKDKEYVDRVVSVIAQAMSSQAA